MLAKQALYHAELMPLADVAGIACVESLIFLRNLYDIGRASHLEKVQNSRSAGTLALRCRVVPVLICDGSNRPLASWPALPSRECLGSSQIAVGGLLDLGRYGCLGSDSRPSQALSALRGSDLGKQVISNFFPPSF